MSTSAQNSTQPTKSVGKSISPSSVSNDDGDYFLVSRGSLLRSKDAVPVLSESTDATSDTKINQKIPDSKLSGSSTFIPKRMVDVSSVVSKASKAMRGKRMVSARINYVLANFNTTANTSNTVQALDPSLSSEFAAFAALYEQCRTKRVRVTYYPGSNLSVAAASGISSTTTVGVMAVDTTRATTLSGLSDGADSSFHAVYHQALINTDNKTCTRPIRDGHVHFEPTGSSNLALATAGINIVGASWFDCIGTPGNQGVVGYLKFFEKNDQATSVAIGTILYEFDVEFRNRD